MYKTTFFSFSLKHNIYIHRIFDFVAFLKIGENVFLNLNIKDRVLQARDGVKESEEGYTHSSIMQRKTYSWDGKC